MSSGFVIRTIRKSSATEPDLTVDCIFCCYSEIDCYYVLLKIDKLFLTFFIKEPRYCIGALSKCTIPRQC